MENNSGKDRCQQCNHVRRVHDGPYACFANTDEGEECDCREFKGAPPEMPATKAWLFARVRNWWHEVASYEPSRAPEFLCQFVWQIAEEARRDERKRMGEENPLATAWAPRDIVQKLADAATHLLSDHDCDTHGWEEIQRTRDEALKWLRTESAVSPPSPPKPEDVYRQAYMSGVRAGRHYAEMDLETAKTHIRRLLAWTHGGACSDCGMFRAAPSKQIFMHHEACAHLEAINAARAFLGESPDESHSFEDASGEMRRLAAERMRLYREQSTEQEKTTGEGSAIGGTISQTAGTLSKDEPCPVCGIPWEGGLHKAFCLGPRTSDTPIGIDRVRLYDTAWHQACYVMATDSHYEQLVRKAIADGKYDEVKPRPDIETVALIREGMPLVRCALDTRHHFEKAVTWLRQAELWLADHTSRKSNS